MLYLRSFRDDDLIVHGASYTRPTALERVAFGRRQRYEEVVAEELQLYAPISAVGEPGRRLAPLGAAREVLPDETWRVHVGELMARSSAIVIVLGRSAGLDWELRQLASSGAWRRAILLIPPVDTVELVARWDHAAGILSRHGFRDLCLPPEGPALLAMTFTDDRRCRFYTARSPTIWSYETAAAAALADCRTAQRRTVTS